MLSTLKTNSIEFVRLSRLYAARQPALPALAAYPTLDALVAALAGPTRADEDTRRRLVCAVLVDHQAAPGPLGPAIVLHAFRGMLLRLSRSLHGVDDADDADARVSVGLLEALRHVHPERDPAGIGLRVRQETRRAVFAVLKREALARPPRPGDEEDEEEPTPRAEAPPGEDGAEAEEVEARPPDDDPQGNRDPAAEEGPRDPMQVKAAARCLDPDALADAESLVPLRGSPGVPPPDRRERAGRASAARAQRPRRAAPADEPPVRARQRARSRERVPAAVATHATAARADEIDTGKKNRPWG